MTFPFPLFRLSAFKIAFFLTIILIAIMIYKYFRDGGGGVRFMTSEGFTQTSPFVLKRDSDIYDDFYITIYDTLTDIENRHNDVLDNIINITKPDTETTQMLYVGSGTGFFINELHKKGYNFIGIDKSPHMIKHSIQKYPHLKPHIKLIDAENGATVYERNRFTHIMCLYLTLYEIHNKDTFFRNCFYTLNAGGFLIIHLINNATTYGKSRKGIDLLHLGKPNSLNNDEIINQPNIKKSLTRFNGITYKRDWTDPNIIKETFTDTQTQHIRQNELTMDYEPVTVIIEKCLKSGFKIYSHVPYSNNVDGILYFFIKPR